MSGAERRYRATLAALQKRRPSVDAYIADRSVIYVLDRGYVGALAAMAFGDQMPFVPHAGWIADPIAGEPWAQVPHCPSTGISWLSSPGADYAAGCAAIRAQVLGQMANAFPRRLVVTWIDPIGRGASAGALLELLEIDKDLMDTQVWSEPDEIERALRRITERMAYLEQRCLKSRFADLDEYNMQAGSLAEPQHVVVVTGYPRGFTDETLARLDQIVDGGRRLGITVHLVADESAEPLRLGVGEKHGYPALQNVGFPRVDRQPTVYGHLVFGHAGRPHVQMWVDSVDEAVWLPASFQKVSDELARAIVEGYASAAVAATNVVIDAETLTRSTGGSTAGEIVLPVGALGRGDRFDLRLGRGLAQNVLVGGLPGSGKSTLFHSIISAAVRAYDPAELELYLLDFKQGVEFQPYAEAGLPHARVVAVQSERVFGVSVLAGLRDELTARAARFKEVGASSLAEFRARTGEVLPRVLVVIDEFQVLFAAEDALAFECAAALEHLVRQGRSYGVHMVLGTQTMRGSTYRLLGPAIDLIALRVALKTSEADSELFLAPDNRAASRLTRPGEAIFNPDGGSPEGNLAFQVALTTDEARDRALVRAREQADRAGWTRRPLVFDGTRAIGVGDDERLSALVDGATADDPRAVRLYWGLPVAIGGDGTGALWRRGGAHALLIGRDWPLIMGPLTVGLTTACLSGVRPGITVVDCLGIDEDHGATLGEVAALLPDARCVRRNKLTAVLAETAAEVRRRTSEDDYTAPRRLLVINAVQRARELDDADSYEPSGASADLTTILRDGADVGVHVVLTADGVDTVYRRAGRDALAHFGVRLVGQCSPAASDALVGSPAASTLGPTYLLVSEPDEHRLEQLRPYPVPNAAWFRTALRTIR